MQSLLLELKIFFLHVGVERSSLFFYVDVLVETHTQMEFLFKIFLFTDLSAALSLSWVT